MNGISDISSILASKEDEHMLVNLGKCTQSNDKISEGAALLYNIMLIKIIFKS